MTASAPAAAALRSSDPVSRQRPDVDLINMMRRRVSGTYELDPWGLDRDAALLASRLSALRWHVETTGLGNLGADGPALLVANRRLGWSEPAVAAAGILDGTGRFVRAAGGLDLDPIGGLARKLGAIPARADDIAAALRAGEVVLVPTRRELVRFRAGHLPIELLEPAVAAGVPVVPVAVVGWEVGRRWQVSVGTPVVAENASGPRAVGQVAVGVANTLRAMLSEAHKSRLSYRLRLVAPRRKDEPEQVGEI